MMREKLWARISEDEMRRQPLQEHLEAVRQQMQKTCGKIGLGETGAFIGRYHDMFKAARRWQQERLCKRQGDKVPHGPPTGLWLWLRFGKNPSDNKFKGAHGKLAAIMVAMVIDGHHGGLDDIIRPDSYQAIFEERKNETDYEIFWKNEQGEQPELLQWERDFLEAYPPFAQIDAQFDRCVREIAKLDERAVGTVLHMLPDNGRITDVANDAYRIVLGLAVRYLSSALIDADRYDAWRFEMGLPLEGHQDEAFKWRPVVDAFEANLQRQAQSKSGKASAQISELRAKISDEGKDFVHRLHAKKEDAFGIRRLTLPTGAGKTFTSFRIALYQALLQKHERIFIVTPRLSILDQTGKDLRDVLAEHGKLLFEHHSNVVVDAQNADAQELERYEMFTERWSTEKIVLTSLVHFLDALYQGSTQNVRRMQALANSVIIIDEVQDVPDSSLYLFNMALCFLSKLCGCSILLCSATQPILDQVDMPLAPMKEREIIPEYAQIFQKFRRVNLDMRAAGREYTYAKVVEFALDRLQGEIKSILIIANTRPGVRELTRLILQQAPELEVFSLTTNACAAHRLYIIEAIKAQLGKRPLICVSTSLVEYGVNLSFDCVIRLNCGLDHLAQAVGRCNRHGEAALRTCYLLDCKEEKRNKLYAVQQGWESMQEMLIRYPDADFMEPELLEIYYRLYFERRKGQFAYPVRLSNRPASRLETLVNLYGYHVIEEKNDHSRYLLRQAFRTAGRLYHVIQDEGTAVIAPYGREGAELGAALYACNACKNRHCISCGKGLERATMTLQERLRKSQRYSVSISRHLFEQAGGDIALYLENIGVYVLKDQYYDKNAGLCLDGKGDPEEYIY